MCISFPSEGTNTRADEAFEGLVFNRVDIILSDPKKDHPETKVIASDLGISI